jgi:RNA polymerase sigma-70 factor (ECF subfamily)
MRDDFSDSSDSAATRRRTVAPDLCAKAGQRRFMTARMARVSPTIWLSGDAMACQHLRQGFSMAPSPPASKLTLTRLAPDRTSDARLVRGVAEGDRDALSMVWDRYAKLVRSVLFGALGPDQAAEDLLQEVFLAFYRGAARIRDAGALRGYLVAAAVRMAALELRKRKVRRWIGLSASGELPELPVPPQDSEAREALRALYRVLDQLGNRRRLAFALRHVQGMELLEVAAALHISESTARRELFRAREQLAALSRREPALARYLDRKLAAGGEP